MKTLYITGAGVSADSGIPTFRGKDGFWTIGSRHYSPMEMATRAMYQQQPEAFLSWYFHRFAQYRNVQPNEVHYWLADKDLITQNIDGLDGKAGNTDYIAIHGRLDKMTQYTQQVDGMSVDLLDAPWDAVDPDDIGHSLLQLFKIQHRPKLDQSLKPHVLLFDEFYTDAYGIRYAQQKMQQAEKMVFMGTSFSVNITQMALDIAINNGIPIEVVDPEPVHLPYAQVTYQIMSALEYVSQHGST